MNFAFLDSGTGGLPYMLYLKHKCPDMTCAYLGDTLHFPYGEKTPEQITMCASQSVSLIMKKWHPQAVVVACNTISVTALDNLRASFSYVPIVGTVPAIKVAAEVSHNKRIGLLATNATVRHPYIQRLERDFASDCTLFSRGDAELVSFIEHDLFTASYEQKVAAVKPAVNYFTENDCDTIILGCTHFIHMADIISHTAGKAVQIIDSREGVVRQALKVENAHEPDAADSLCAGDEPDDSAFFVTGLRQKKDADEYSILCHNLNIKWGGILS
ncbi:MAG: glutamate racemase [Treponema sp.]|nr:glutamate racemase [Treponema sp.]